MEPEIGANWAPVARENEGDLALLERQDVEGTPRQVEDEGQARGSSLSTDVLVISSVVVSVSVKDMVQSSVPIYTRVGIQPTSSDTVGSLCFNESKARDFEKWTNLVLTSNAFPGSHQQGIGATSRENLLGDVCSRSDRSLLASSLQRTFDAAWPVYRGGCRT